MDLSPREAAFVLKEMERVENSEGRQSYERADAARVRRKAEDVLTE